MSSITRANWHVSYLGGPGGGLRLGACDYAGVRVIHSAAVPFVYVDYLGDSSGPFTDNLDCKDTLQVRDVMNGFDLKVSYDFGDRLPLRARVAVPRRRAVRLGDRRARPRERRSVDVTPTTCRSGSTST